MSEAANAAGASAPAAIGQGSQKREFVPASNAQKPKAQPSQSLPDTKGAKDASSPFKGTKHKVEIDGQEAEIDYDELRRGYQRAQAANRRFEEAKKLQESAPEEHRRRQEQLQAELNRSRGVLEALERGDLGYLTHKLGKAKAKELMENFLIEDMEYEALPPAEKRARELEAKLKAKEDKEAEDKKKAEAKALDEARAKAHHDLDTEVGEALKEIGRKPTPRLVIRIVDEMMAKLDSKEEAVPAKFAAQKAIKGIYADIAEYLPQLDSVELMKVLPPEVIEKIRQHQVDQVLGEKSQRRTKPSTPSQPSKQGKKMGVDEWFKNLDTKYKKQG
jgi:hypothetical protein